MAGALGISLFCSPTTNPAASEPVSLWQNRASRVPYSGSEPEQEQEQEPERKFVVQPRDLCHLFRVPLHLNDFGGYPTLSKPIQTPFRMTEAK